MCTYDVSEQEDDENPMPSPVEQLEHPVGVPSLCRAVGRDREHSEVKRLKSLQTSSRKRRGNVSLEERIKVSGRALKTDHEPKRESI